MRCRPSWSLSTLGSKHAWDKNRRSSVTSASISVFPPHPMPSSSRSDLYSVPSKGRFRPLKKFGKFGIFSKLSKLSNFPRSTMWKWTSTSRSVLVHFHIVESGKLESLENTPLLLQPWYTVLSRSQKGKQG